MGQPELVTAAVLEERGILKRGTAYKMCRAKKLVCYRTGVAGRGIRFRVDEVLAALRCPVSHEVRK